MTNCYKDITPLIQEYRTKQNGNLDQLMNRILHVSEELAHIVDKKNDTINKIWNEHETEKFLVAQRTLDPLEQVLYSSLIGIRTLSHEVQSESAKMYLDSLKGEIESQLDELKKSSLHLYPICMQDLGPFGAIKSHYELLKNHSNITIDIEFRGKLKRQSQKVERLIYRLIQQFIELKNTFTTISQLAISIHETDENIVVTFEGTDLLENLNKSSDYQWFGEIIDSMENVCLVKRNDSQVELVLQKKPTE